jgi:hypothetical protein
MTETRRVLLAMSFGLALAMGGSSAAVEPKGEEVGVAQICIAPLGQGFEVPAHGEEIEVSSETVVVVDEAKGGVDNTLVALPDRRVTVEVETRGEIVAGRTSARSLGPLSTKERSLIKLREDGKIVQSFLFQRTRGHEAGYCLVYRAGLKTWAILPLEDVGEWCACNHRAYVAPVIPLEKQEGE